MNESVPEPDGIDAIALSHVRVSLGAKLMEVLKRIGFSDAELVKFDMVTFEDGPPPIFTAPPFQAARLRDKALKLKAEFGGSEPIIIEVGERRSA